MSDNITLPREVAEGALEALEYAKRVYGGYSKEAKALRAALAAEQPSEDIEALRRDAERFWMVVAAMNEKLKPVAWMFVNLDGECEHIEYGTPPTDDDSITPLYIAPPEDEVLRRENEKLREENKQLREAIRELMEAEASPGGARGGFIKRLASREHEARVQKAWMSLKAALRREDQT